MHCYPGQYKLIIHYTYTITIGHDQDLTISIHEGRSRVIAATMYIVLIGETGRAEKNSWKNSTGTKVKAIKKGRFLSPLLHNRIYLEETSVRNNFIPIIVTAGIFLIFIIIIIGTCYLRLRSNDKKDKAKQQNKEEGVYTISSAALMKEALEKLNAKDLYQVNESDSEKSNVDDSETTKQNQEKLAELPEEKKVIDRTMTVASISEYSSNDEQKAFSTRQNVDINNNNIRAILSHAEHSLEHNSDKTSDLQCVVTKENLCSNDDQRIDTAYPVKWIMQLFSEHSKTWTKFSGLPETNTKKHLQGHLNDGQLATAGIKEFFPQGRSPVLGSWRNFNYSLHSARHKEETDNFYSRFPVGFTLAHYISTLGQHVNPIILVLRAHNPKSCACGLCMEQSSMVSVQKASTKLSQLDGTSTRTLNKTPIKSPISITNILLKATFTRSTDSGSQ